MGTYLCRIDTLQFPGRVVIVPAWPASLCGGDAEASVWKWRNHSSEKFHCSISYTDTYIRTSIYKAFGDFFNIGVPEVAVVKHSSKECIL